MNKLFRFLTDKNMRTLFFDSRGFYDNLSDERYLKKIFKARVGYKLNLESPESFNEKMQWLKLHQRDPVFTTMVDKHAVKEYAKGLIGDQYIIPTLGIWDSFEEIDFNTLPEKFVLKCTHDSGGIVICKDKSNFDFQHAKQILDKYMKRDFYMVWREWPYKNVPHRIIAEKYLEDGKGQLKDYKFFCFNGVAKFFKVDFDRFSNHRANYYNLNNELLELGELDYPPDPQRESGISIEDINKIKSLAETMANGFPFLRVDFYDINGIIYLGELTLYPASGFGKFCYPDNDGLLGSWLKLPL